MWYFNIIVTLGEPESYKKNKNNKNTIHWRPLLRTNTFYWQRVDNWHYSVQCTSFTFIKFITVSFKIFYCCIHSKNMFLWYDSLFYMPVYLVPIKLTLEYGLGWLINVNCNTECKVPFTNNVGPQNNNSLASIH